MQISFHGMWSRISNSTTTPHPALKSGSFPLVLWGRPLLLPPPQPLSVACCRDWGSPPPLHPAALLQRGVSRQGLNDAPAPAALLPAASSPPAAPAAGAVLCLGHPPATPSPAPAPCGRARPRPRSSRARGVSVSVSVWRLLLPASPRSLPAEDGGRAARRRLPQRPEGRPAAGSRRAAAGLR